MASEQVLTLDNPAGLLLTPELLREIGVGAGDQIKVSVRESILTIRPFDGSLTERERLEALQAAEVLDDEARVTFRELIKEELISRGIQQAVGVKVVLANGQELLFTNSEDQRLDEMVRQIDVKEIILKQSARAGGPTMDEIMRDLLERRRVVYEKLAEGAP